MDSSFGLEERRRQIRGLLEERSQIRASPSSAQRFCASPTVTIRGGSQGARRDRRRWCACMAVRCRGARATSCPSTSSRTCIARRRRASLRLRSSSSSDGETVILDSGTTTAEIAQAHSRAQIPVAQCDHECIEHRRAAGQRAVHQPRSFRAAFCGGAPGRCPVPRPKTRSATCRRTRCFSASTVSIRKSAS